MKTSRVLAVGLCVVTASAGTTAAPASPTPGAGTVTAPTATSPNDQAQLASLRPTLTVTNSPAGGTGTRTYEFQVSDKNDFSSTSSPGSFPVLARQTGIPEGSGTTSYTPDFDLQPATRLFWRARVVQGTSVSDWTAARASCTIPWCSATRSARSSDRPRSSAARASASTTATRTCGTNWRCHSQPASSRSKSPGSIRTALGPN